MRNGVFQTMFYHVILQKAVNCVMKAILLQRERIAFRWQKAVFCSVKGRLLHCKTRQNGVFLFE